MKTTDYLTDYLMQHWWIWPVIIVVVVFIAMVAGSFLLMKSGTL